MDIDPDPDSDFDPEERKSGSTQESVHEVRPSLSFPRSAWELLPDAPASRQETAERSKSSGYPEIRNQLPITASSFSSLPHIQAQYILRP
jgi:hypothetical protein